MSGFLNKFYYNNVMSKEHEKPYPYIQDGIVIHRDYCFLLNGQKYNRNIACKYHDNAYGIKGGGNGKDRKKADRIFLKALLKNKDPMAYIIYVAVRIFGWFFFNYKSGALWKGALIKKLNFIHTIF